MEKENRIIIDVSSNKKFIDPMIYSNFIEHLGDCIHNGLWSYDEVSVPMCSVPRLDRVRQGVLEATKELRVKVLRAFGGCYSDVYHWKDAIGPREKRKKIKNKYWGTGVRRFLPQAGPEIENQFGTDEFLIFCEQIGAEPYLNVNYGTGTPEEAADWVEYCNGSVNTEYGKLRAEYGRKDSYNVKYWGIANEIFGFWEKGYEKHPEDYAKKYLTFAKPMREKDPNIKLVACGCFKPGWNQTLLKLLGEEWVDYLSIHRYLPGLWTTLIGKKHPHNAKCYHSLMASDKIFEKHILDTWEDITSALGEGSHVRIAFDEWGVWYKFFDIVRTNYNLQDGIWTALMLMVFQKLSDKCPMANWAQLINCIGTMQSRGDSFWKTSVYLAISLLVNHSYSNIIEGVDVECETFDSKKYAHLPKSVATPFISCNATINDNQNELAIILVNKNMVDNLTLNLELKGFNPKEKGKVFELYSDSPFDYNSRNNPNKIQITEKEIEGIKSDMSIELKAHSVSILRLVR